MTTGTGEPPPPADQHDLSQQLGVPHHHMHNINVPENSPLKVPIATKQPVYTIKQSLQDFPSAPNERFMIHLHLVPHTEGCKTFHDMNWLDCIKHFIGIVKSKDKDFHILKKHGRTLPRNSITTQAQVPSMLAEFEQDFRFDVSIPEFCGK